MLPQDLEFSNEELEKCFGPKMTRKQYLKWLRNQSYGKVGEDNGNETEPGCSKGSIVRFA